MTILDFLHSVIGVTNSAYDFIFLIFSGVLLLLVLDGILSFIFGGISSITMRK